MKFKSIFRMFSFKDIKLGTKMVVSTTLLSILGVSVTAVLLTIIATNLASESLDKQVKQQLVSVRENQTGRIESYFQNVFNRVQTAGLHEPVFAEAAQALKGPFHSYSTDTHIDASTDKQQQGQLQSYYTDEYAREYRDRNPSNPPDMAAHLSSLDRNSQLLQRTYISGNSNPLGLKDELIDSEDGTAYSQLHTVYHERFREFQREQGYYDVFLVDPVTGHIIYSVFKELDFATSLLDGPFAESGIGQAFRGALDLISGETFMSDMVPYLPSYEDQASFVSTPLYIDGNMVGVLIVQVPIDQIDAIMTYRGGWRANGLGDSGETYIVAEDNLMRNNSRFLVDDKEGYLAALESANTSPETINTISAKNSSIGLQFVNTSGVTAALAGVKAIDIFPDYRNIPVLSAYGPIDIPGVNWALLAEIDEAEAFAPVAALNNQIITIASGIGGGVLIVGLLVAFGIVRTITGPIKKFQETLTRLGQGDVDARVSLDRGDELGTLGKAFDKLLDEQVKLQRLDDAENENKNLNDGVIRLLEAVAKLSQKDLTVKVPVSEDVTGPVADGLNMLTKEIATVLQSVVKVAGDVAVTSKHVKQQSDSVMKLSDAEQLEVEQTATELAQASETMVKIARLAHACNTAAAEAIDYTEKAQSTVLGTTEGINAIRDTIRETEKRIKRLGERSQEISGVVNLINNIAERTHILALNASMHAASAGEAGRGFAVVADEVQRLAENARDATSQISALVSNIQVETADTVSTMNDAISQVVSGTKQAESAGIQMDKTQKKTNELVQMVVQIAQGSRNQAKISRKLSDRAEQIRTSTQETNTQLQAQSTQTDRLVGFSDGLIDAVAVFKLPESSSEVRPSLHAVGD